MSENAPPEGSENKENGETAPRGHDRSERSLKQRVIEGFSWVFVGHGTTQVLRLISNIILTRLLFPEAFGLTALVGVFLQGLGMFSNFGIGLSVVQNERGAEPAFLRTVWTMHIIRGMILWFLAAALAWPLAAFYDEPLLMWLLPVAALSAAIEGFTSSNINLLPRRLELRKEVVFQMVCRISGMIVMIATAYVWRSVWALVIGGLAETTIRAVLSHFVLGETKMRIMMDRQIAREIFRFGKWIFVGSIVGYLVGRTDRLVLGKFMTMSALGLYSLALMISLVMTELIMRLSNQLLFPVYARSAEEGVEKLRSHTIRIRRALLAITLPPGWVLVIWGKEIIEIIYDDRYLDAGWMLQVLGVATIFSTILVPVDCVLLAVGDSFRHMILQAVRTAIFICCVAVGGYYFGTNGVIYAVVAASFLYYPVLAIMVRRYRSWFPAIDFAAVALSALVVGVGLWLRS